MKICYEKYCMDKDDDLLQNVRSLTHELILQGE